MDHRFPRLSTKRKNPEYFYHSFSHVFLQDFSEGGTVNNNCASNIPTCETINLPVGKDSAYASEIQTM